MLEGGAQNVTLTGGAQSTMLTGGVQAFDLSAQDVGKFGPLKAGTGILDCMVPILPVFIPPRRNGGKPKFNPDVVKTDNIPKGNQNKPTFKLEVDGDCWTCAAANNSSTIGVA